MIKTIVFDLGGTLIQYKDVPLSWENLYREAILEVGKVCGITLTSENINKSVEILSKYNTRITPREKEVKAETIFDEILSDWEVDTDKYRKDSLDKFFSYFQRKTEMFKETLQVLNDLKSKGYHTAILTDVPYGMSIDYVSKDISKFVDLIDHVKTSVEVGMRKPNSKGYLEIINHFGVEPEEVIFIGDEEKDILGANDIGMYSVYIDRKNKSNSFGENFKITTLDELIDIIRILNG